MGTKTMLSKHLQLLLIVVIVICIGLTATVSGRAYYGKSGTAGQKPLLKASVIEEPFPDWAVHNINKLHLTVTNQGMLGADLLSNGLLCDDGPCPNCEYPINSDLEYLFGGALWIGAVIGRDTLVSIGADGWGETVTEIQPLAGDAGAIIRRSNLASSDVYDPFAVSEQDYVVTMVDTFTDPSITGLDGNDNRDHIPLNLKILRSSYGWSYEYAEDFIIFDYKFVNIGQFPIKDIYLSYYIDADVYHRSASTAGHTDDICGFRRAVAINDPCRAHDSVFIAYIADNDGDPTQDGDWSATSVRAATGVRVLRTPNVELSYSFNWWVSEGNVLLDFGPRLIGTEEDPFVIFPLGNSGTPNGDKIKYYVMSHSEFDYDQLYTGISHTAQGFLPPVNLELARDIADGYDTRYLLSFGPFDIAVNDTLPITLTYLAGDSLHQDPNSFLRNFDVLNPDIFYNTLYFGDFGKNARWADWIFDNPGVDTPDEFGVQDGDSGRYIWHVNIAGQTQCYREDNPPNTSGWLDFDPLPDDLRPIAVKEYYKGDGIPDFRGASPPPAPSYPYSFWVTPEFGKVTLRWNGQASELTADPFSGRHDFEGYRVYYAEGDRETDYILLASFDLEDYNEFVFTRIDDSIAWIQSDAPLQIDSIKILYGPDFDPKLYPNEFSAYVDPSADPIIFPDGRLVYFIPQDWNESDLADLRGIHRVFPQASKTDLTDTTDFGWMRYYEYEYEIPNLLASIPYNFVVTSFDFGSLKNNMGSLESSKVLNAIREYPLPSAEIVEAEEKEVMVYPNPYRIDGEYAKAGYENRDRIKSSERSRRIHFANLPRVCTIRIFSIDGDLIKEIEHNYPSGGPGSQHEEWDVISRNTQAVVSGIYLWHVESEMGEQLGKLVIIK